MKFLAYENIARSTVSFLRALGHDVKDTKEERWFGYPDEKLARLAKREKRILLTLDKDFGNVLLFPPKHNSGIVLISVRNSVPSIVNRLLHPFLEGKTERSFRKKLIIIEEHQIRIRE